MGTRPDQRSGDSPDRSYHGWSVRGAATQRRGPRQGADWQVVTDDGAVVVDTRYLLRLDDGALAFLRTYGHRHGPPEVLARIAQGGVVDSADYYFRMQMTFETASATYGWLNRSIVVGSAMRLASAVVYDAYLVA